MKITLGQLKKVIHSQLAEAKTVKQSAVKKINEVRKSSDAVVSAFLNQQNKRVSNKKSENGVLSLHNNPVAKYGENGGIWISDGGYGISATTAELLNNIPGVRVNIKNRAWMLDGKPWDGQWTKIDFAKFDADFKSRSGTNESRISGEVKKINEVTFTKLIKKLIVEESNDIKGIKLNESITEANTGSESIADKLFRQCMMYPDIIDPIQRIEIFGIIAKKLQDHALLLSKKYARDAKI